MSIDTNLHGRLRNTSLPLGNGLLPVFEAVANAIHAIEDAPIPLHQGNITIEILRDTQAQIDFDTNQKRKGPDPKDNILGFKITDNSIGFNDANMSSFQTLDSEYKASRGGRGVGRLLWLKAFKRAHVKSVFQSDDRKYKQRTFTFRPEDGVANENLEITNQTHRYTSIHLDGFLAKYRKISSKTLPTIANALLEHCL